MKFFLSSRERGYNTRNKTAPDYPPIPTGNERLSPDRTCLPPSPPVRRNIALVAHNACKNPLIRFAQDHYVTLSLHNLWSTANTGKALMQVAKLKVQTLLSGPLGGDQQLGAMIAEGQIDILFFFWDPLSAHAHGADVKALVRISVLYNIPYACNLATAELLLENSLFTGHAASPSSRPRREAHRVENYILSLLT